MRAAPVMLLLILAAATGCGKKDEPRTGPPPAQPDAGLVKSWKPHTANEFRFKAIFPFGDPTVSPAFIGNQPKAVAAGEDYSVPVHEKGGGQEGNLFGIRAARFRGKPSSADRDETLGILVKGRVPPGWTKSEPKTVTWAGQPATETTWSDPAQSTKIVVRQLATDSVVYVGYVRDLGRLSPAEVAKFFDGFQLIGK